MKNYIYIIGMFYMMACSKSINEDLIKANVPQSVDASAGNWKTYVLNSNEEFAVATPTDVNSTSYLTELASLKNASSNLTAPQTEIVNYWQAGAVYRWNEIARELSAKYNLPPAANAEGKYPIPDAANPLADPHYPFANPPFTARALAYLSVAQYDALVSTWHYKYKFNRQAPSVSDPSIISKLPVTSIPTYPSEDAVVAGASYAILVLMFPGEIPYLSQKLEDSKYARIWSGMNVTSDIVAGETLGKAVAAKVIAQSKTDGMSASNNQTLTAGMFQNAQKLGIKNPWVSQEAPLRPPMLPNYGAVKPWNFDQSTMAAIRPTIPYLEGSDSFNKDLNELKSIAKNQTREQARIANYWADGPSSYTPPGHWHRIAANNALNNKYSEVKMARTLAVVGTTLMDAGIACWETKYYYYSPRPQQFGLKTSVGLPNFPSYTSGHSTFSSAAATVLSYIFPDKSQEFNNFATEASNSRVYGLIHFRVDCEMGLAHGTKIANYAIERAKKDGSGL